MRALKAIGWIILILVVIGVVFVIVFGIHFLSSRITITVNDAELAHTLNTLTSISIASLQTHLIIFTLIFSVIAFIGYTRIKEAIKQETAKEGEAIMRNLKRYEADIRILTDRISKTEESADTGEAVDTYLVDSGDKKEK